MTDRVFVDTGALLALAGIRDQYHARALDIAEHHMASGGTWVGTTLVLAELDGLLLKRSGPTVARRSVSALLHDPAYEWLDVSRDLVSAAIGAWLERYPNQRFTLTDAVSFEAMRRERLRRAFAFDTDFVTAGFELLS